MTAARLRLRCPRCGPVRVAVGAAVVHHNREDGFRLLQASCPDCAEVVVTNDAEVVDLAVTSGVCVRELLPPAPALTDADVDRLHAALDDEEWVARFLDGPAPDHDPGD
jgi:ribosomal protein S27AE